MSDNIENKAARGSISQIILTALSDGNKYGYEICKDIEKISNGKLILKQPSLYSSLRRMEEQGLINSYWQDSDLGGKRHYYSLTEQGKILFEKNKEVWKNNEDLINSLPENINQEDIVDMNEDMSKKDLDTPTLVANQENLFNLTSRKQEEIKKITNSDDESDKQTFLQFDFFDQNIKHVKSSEKTNIDNISSFTNKFSELDNHAKEIEPEKMFSSEKLNNNEELLTIQEEPILAILSQDIAIIRKNEEMKINDKNEVKKEILPVMKKNEVKKITWEISENDCVSDSTPLFENKDYKSAIGELYSHSKLKDPYEQNKYQTFKEIFPSSQLKNNEQNFVEESEESSKIDEIVKANKESNIDCDDIKMLNSLYNLQGINIKLHNDIENKRQNKVYTDKNRLNMVSAWIITIIALIEIIGSYFVLNNNNYIIRGQTVVYFLSAMLMLSYCLIQTLENIFDRFKLVKIKSSFKKNFITKLLISLLLIVGIFAINLAFGMTSLLQREFLSFWLIPSFMAINLLIKAIVYQVLLSSKSFNS